LKEFYNRPIFGKVMEVMGESWLPQVPCALGHCWKMKNSLEIWHMVGRNCCDTINTL